jgi:hypothetical protein
MCPPPFLRLTITERRLPGVVKLYSIEASGFWVLGSGGKGMPNIQGKWPF